MLPRLAVPLVILLAVPLAAAGPVPDDTAPGRQVVALVDEAAALKLRMGLSGKKVKAAEVAQELRPAVATALNDWASLADAHELDVVVSRDADVLVLGGAKLKVMTGSLEVLERTSALMDPLVPRVGDRKDAATVVFLFDWKGYRSDAWPALLDALVERKALVDQGAAHLKKHPGGLMLRHQGILLQPAMDMAGNASAGDEEFSLENELANKFTQCLVTRRVGPLPPNIRWGLGYVAEQGLFGTTYMFNATGFVWNSDHFDWPQKARQAIENREDDFALSAAALDTTAAGSGEEPQILTWAALEYLRQHDSADLTALMAALGAEHARVDRGGSTLYVGSETATRDLLVERLDGIDLDDMMNTMKKLR